MTEVRFLSQHLCSPRKGHLNAFYKVFMYLKNNISNNPRRVSFDTSCVHTDEKVFEGSTREL